PGRRPERRLRGPDGCLEAGVRRPLAGRLRPGGQHRVPGHRPAAGRGPSGGRHGPPLGWVGWRRVGPWTDRCRRCPVVWGGAPPRGGGGGRRAGAAFARCFPPPPARLAARLSPASPFVWLTVATSRGRSGWREPNSDGRVSAVTGRPAL